MSALFKQQTEQALHHWMLWVAPTSDQTNKIRSLSKLQKEKVLMLHPKKANQVYSALQLAIHSQLYQCITISKGLLSTQEQHNLKVQAVRNNTVLTLLNPQKNLNSASQLSLI
ncbi:MAG: hypothetical protein V7785_05285 [Bermanella sp.]